MGKAVCRKYPEEQSGKAAETGNFRNKTGKNTMLAVKKNVTNSFWKVLNL